MADIAGEMKLKSGRRIIVPTGLYIELPKGYEAQIRSRSGLTLAHGIVVANGVGTIDADYRGEIKVILHNISTEDYTVKSGDKIAQMVINEVIGADFIACETISDTARGDKGFGHTGK
jgi:dUTP pyrophosphatase